MLPMQCLPIVEVGMVLDVLGSVPGSTNQVVNMM